MNTKKRLLALALLFVLGVFGTFAGEVRGAGDRDFGEVCASTTDCIIPLLCVSEECVECRNDSDCNNEQEGQNRVCQEQRCVEGEATTDEGGDGGDNPLGNFPGRDFDFADLIGIITGLACWLGRIATAVMVIFIALAGFRFMLARADPKAFSGAVANLKTVLWGILVIYGTYVIIATVANAVGITDFSFIPLVC